MNMTSLKCTRLAGSKRAPEERAPTSGPLHAHVLHVSLPAHRAEQCRKCSRISMRISPTCHSWPASNGNAAASAAESMVLNCSRAAAISELPVTIPDDQPKLQPGTRRHLGRSVGNSNSTRDTGRSTYDSVGSGKGVNMGSTTVAAGIKGKPQPHPRQAE